DYIRECIESVLNQKLSFQYEILIGDDDSTDGTREICMQYAKQYPEKIKLFLHKRENNILIEGRPSGRFNFIYNLYSARGKYIAFCEGDDYWTNTDKLQQQIKILESNKIYNICFHNAFIANGKHLTQNKIYKDNRTPIVEFVDLLQGDYTKTSCSVIR